MRSFAKIEVIGSNMVDLIAYINQMPATGEILLADDFVMGCGGKAANQAVAAAMLGGRVMMMSKVGDDMITDRLWRLSAIGQLCLSLRCAGLAPVP